MRPKIGLWLVLGAVIAVVACAAAPELPPVPRYTPAQLASVHWRAVLVAGDGRLRVFDDAVASMADWLHQRGVGPDEIARLSATPATIAGHGADSASWGHILHAIRDMKAGPGEACLVYVTSHGIRGEGVELSFDGAVLWPGELDRALAIGCGNAPTVAIVSACFSGSFAAPPMERANRIVITAARADRTSFGCSADQTYTYFDRCLLANLDRAPTWQALFDAARACVEQRERRNRFVSSQPQGWFGQAVAEMPLPGSPPYSAGSHRGASRPIGPATAPCWHPQLFVASSFDRSCRPMLIQSNLGHVLARHAYGSPLGGGWAVSRCRNRVSSTPATILDIYAERRWRDRPFFISRMNCTVKLRSSTAAVR